MSRGSLALPSDRVTMVAGLPPRWTASVQAAKPGGQGEGQMTEKPSVKSAAPESPPNGPEHNPPPVAGARRGRSRWRKFLVPIVLAALGLGLIVVAWFLYPRRAAVEGVTGAGVVITGSSPY